MALTDPQIRILSLISANRSPNSLFAGGAVANRDGPRLSEDLDIEHVSAAAVRQSFEIDQKTLQSAGYKVMQTERSQPKTGFIEAVATVGEDQVLLDWTTDTAVRFFPAIPDEVFGWRLHDADIALNKLLALAGRREVRDYYDVMRLHAAGYRLGTLAWAAMGKDAGMSPELVLDEASRHSIYSADEFRRGLVSRDPIDPVELKRRFLQAIDEARDEIHRMTVRSPETVGMLTLETDGAFARLDPDALDRREIVLHQASVGGAWPQIPDGSERP